VRALPDRDAVRGAGKFKNEGEENMKSWTQYSLRDLEYLVQVMVSDKDLTEPGAPGMAILMQSLLEKISEALTQEFIKTRGQEVLARIDPQAIANLCVANGAAKINATMNKKYPDVVKETVREVITPVFLDLKNKGK